MGRMRSGLIHGWVGHANLDKDGYGWNTKDGMGGE